MTCSRPCQDSRHLLAGTAGFLAYSHPGCSQWQLFAEMRRVWAHRQLLAGSLSDAHIIALHLRIVRIAVEGVACDHLCICK